MCLFSDGYLSSLQNTAYCFNNKQEKKAAKSPFPPLYITIYFTALLLAAGAVTIRLRESHSWKKTPKKQQQKEHYRAAPSSVQILSCAGTSLPPTALFREPLSGSSALYRSSGAKAGRWWQHSQHTHPSPARAKSAPSQKGFALALLTSRFLQEPGGRSTLWAQALPNHASCGAGRCMIRWQDYVPRAGKPHKLGRF